MARLRLRVSRRPSSPRRPDRFRDSRYAGVGRAALPGEPPPRPTLRATFSRERSRAAIPQRASPMAPRVLISDKLSPAAVAIFKERGVEVDVKPGLDKDELARIIGDYDGLAIRSTHQSHRQTARTREEPEGRRSRGHRRRQCRHSRRDRARRHRDEHAVRQFDHHRRTRHRADVRARPPDPRPPTLRRRPASGRRTASWASRSPARRSASSDAATSARSSPRARIGLKMRVIAFDPFLSDERAAELGVEKVELDDLLARADFITLHTPLTAQTRNILSAENLAKTKKGVRIINCARGGLVDEAALAAALDQRPCGWRRLRRLRRGACDVEPAVRPSERHRDAASGRLDDEAQENVALQVAEQMSDYLIARRDLQRGQLPVDHRRGSAEAEALHRAGRGARLLRRSADRGAHREGDDHL